MNAALFLCVCATNIHAQERDIKKLTHEKRHKVAHQLINKKSYYNASEHLEELVKEHPNNKKYVHRLADAYFLARDYKNAEKWYEQAVKMDGKTVTIALFRYAESLKYNGKYEEAKKNFEAFAKSKFKEKGSERLKALANNEVLSCEYAIKNNSIENPLEVIHLGDHVNSRYTEFSPVLFNDTTLIFASLQSDSVITVKYDEAHTYHVKLMKATLQNDTWSQATELPQVNTLFESNANGTFSPDKSRFYFTRCVPDHNNHMICKIYYSDIKDGKFSKPQKLDKTINAPGATTTMPHMTSVIIGKKKTDVLFFVSNRKGSIGGLDIWYAFADGKGGFNPPVNLGKTINSIRDEISPFYEPSSGKLYFSSNYHHGFGGYDVFRSSSKQFGQWTKPENIGKPINSRVDDTYYNINPNTNEGFFVSNRPEGYHLTSETCCDDIYSFKFKNPFLIRVNIYSKGTNIRPDSFFLITKTKALAGLYDYSLPQINSSDTDTSHNADSLINVRKNQIHSYLINNLNSAHTLPENKIMDNSFFPELKGSMAIYDAEPGKEYFFCASDRKDTVMITFSTPDKQRSYINAYTPDTSKAKITTINTPKIDLIQITLFLDKKIPADTQKVVAQVETEKTHTVARLKESMLKSIEKDLKVILNYDFDDANFIRDHASSLDSIVALLKEFPQLNILITAHTDSKGSERYNLELSKRRALSIENYLQQHGIEKKRMKSKGMGEAEPLVPNENPDGSDNPENRSINRRAEIIIIE